MNDKELLEVLKNEMLLAKARALGAQEAYRIKAISIAWDGCIFRPGERILITFTDGDKLAFLDKIGWSTYEFERYEGPALYGWLALKDGRRSKTYVALCKASALTNGCVKPADAKHKGAGT